VRTFRADGISTQTASKLPELQRRQTKMGSTHNGDAGPALAGTALPKDIKTDCAGAACVRVDGRA
jgi:hypothetical protein